MNRTLGSLVAASLVIATAACSSSGHHSTSAAGPAGDSTLAVPVATSPGAASSTAAGNAGSGSGHDSQFCDLARQIGSAGLSAPDPLDGDQSKIDAAIAQIDRMKSVAPDEIRADFAVFDQFEHAINDPGSVPVPSEGSQQALVHVAQYFTEVCGV